MGFVTLSQDSLHSLWNKLIKTASLGRLLSYMSMRDTAKGECSDFWASHLLHLLFHMDSDVETAVLKHYMWAFDANGWPVLQISGVSSTTTSQGPILTSGDLDPCLLQKMKPFSDCFAESAPLDCQEHKLWNLEELCFLK